MGDKCTINMSFSTDEENQEFFKSVDKLRTEHTAQLLNYLKATNLPLGILINYGEQPLKYKIVPNFIKSNT